MTDLVNTDALRPFGADGSLGDPSAYLANAYLGCWGIVDALQQGPTS